MLLTFVQNHIRFCLKEIVLIVKSEQETHKTKQTKNMVSRWLVQIKEELNAKIEIFNSKFFNL